MQLGKQDQGQFALDVSQIYIFSFLFSNFEMANPCLVFFSLPWKPCRTIATFSPWRILCRSAIWSPCRISLWVPWRIGLYKMSSFPPPFGWRHFWMAPQEFHSHSTQGLHHVSRNRVARGPAKLVGCRAPTGRSRCRYDFTSSFFFRFSKFFSKKSKKKFVFKNQKKNQNFFFLNFKNFLRVARVFNVFFCPGHELAHMWFGNIVTMEW